MVTALTAALASAEAQAKSSASGGYSRPSGSVRTPSFSPSRPSVRTPSTSGGYARPPLATTSRPSFAPPPSAGDLAVSRQRSADALGAYRAQQEAARRPPPPVGPAPSGGSTQGPTQGPTPSGGAWNWGGGAAPAIRWPERPAWYAQRGWTSPGGIFGAPRAFGVWDALFLWMLVSNLTRAGAADFFYHHQNDPGYQQWRSEADRLAQDNADLREKLRDLDRQLAQRQGTPLDPGYLPPDIPSSVALAMPTDVRTPSVGDPVRAADDDGGGWLWIAIIAGGAVIGWAVWQRVRRGRETGGGSMRILGNAGAMLRHKLSGEGYKPDRFRVGMTFAFDPTPFLLAQGATKIAPPTADTGSGRLTVTAVGTLQGPAVTLTRLYLPDNRSVFQIHTDPTGTPDECRFFSRIDEVAPASAQEWDAWLHPAEGMIGWPQFQTRDGTLYDRVWVPGPQRIAPLDLAESIETAEGGQPRVIRRQCMLYAASTGAASPAPGTEYILVSVVEEAGQAWVEIAAGIDVSPGLLDLS